MSSKTLDNPDFEESLERLETIVESMESGDIPLAELVSKFEEGNNLLIACQKRLKDAELKIDKLKNLGVTRAEKAKCVTSVRVCKFKAHNTMG